jgi:hypothetical protein
MTTVIKLLAENFTFSECTLCGSFQHWVCPFIIIIIWNAILSRSYPFARSGSFTQSNNYILTMFSLQILSIHFPKSY